MGFTDLMLEWGWLPVIVVGIALWGFVIWVMVKILLHCEVI